MQRAQAHSSVHPYRELIAQWWQEGINGTPSMESGSFVVTVELRAALYAIEDNARGRPAEERSAARRARASPQLEALKAQLEQTLRGVSRKSALALAIHYALTRFAG